MQRRKPENCIMCWNDSKDSPWVYAPPERVRDKYPQIKGGPMCEKCIKVERDRLKPEVFKEAYKCQKK